MNTQPSPPVAVTGRQCMICLERSRLTRRPGDTHVRCETCDCLWRWEELVKPAPKPSGTSA